MAATLDSRLAAALAGDRVPVLPDGGIRVESNEIGILAVATGELIARDPFIGGRRAFSRRCPKGRFPVQLLIVHSEGPDERIAAATLRFSTGIPDRWEMALLPGQDLAVLGPEEFFGYGVDSGTGSFMDAEAARQLDLRIAQDASYADTIIERMQETYKDTRSWALIDLDSDGEPDVALFSSGEGDGMYASYWGWSGRELACLVTDFGLFYDD